MARIRFCASVGSMTDVNGRPLRKDAELNRQRLLAAATELFCERGLDVTLNDVAHHAGVGVGTAYRRWANKEQLIDELFARKLDDVAALGAEALEDPDAWHGLTTFLEGSLRMQLEDRGLKQLLSDPELGHEQVNRARERIAPLVEAIVGRARTSGRLRPEFAATDAIFIQLALGALMDRTRDIDPKLYRRYLTMFLDGVRADGPRSELPVAALSVEQTHTVMTSPSEVPSLDEASTDASQG
jgi:AcrR family transcriptional regulator